jgi:hypothetical protein
MPLPAGPTAATAVLPDLADAPEPVRYAVGAELLYALRILPRPDAFEPDPAPTLTGCTCGPRAVTRCGHCAHCDRCHDCGRCSGPGCRCTCEGER